MPKILRYLAVEIILSKKRKKISTERAKHEKKSELDACLMDSNCDSILLRVTCARTTPAIEVLEYISSLLIPNRRHDENKSNPSDFYRTVSAARNDGSGEHQINQDRLGIGNMVESSTETPRYSELETQTPPPTGNPQS
ncbi:hypothetical protein KIN20_012977 [Parelaphostrongylus tenuis]|uniref:Uncharacterized protein n=1 Tax=Parelaphostrongylus tenuis TaxID=148309 RepID=A0AAD5MWW4_PARTN|nr:hypothetical protein KIN20_012977 [Parelaphostrongylus tenuis]